MNIFFLLSGFLTLKPEMLMALCAVISLVTQYLFSGAQKRLFNRRTRAFEPDFEKAERDYAGPAQARLKKRKDRIVSGGSLSSGVLDKIRGIGITTIIVAACFAFGVFSEDPVQPRIPAGIEGPVRQSLPRQDHRRLRRRDKGRGGDLRRSS